MMFQKIITMGALVLAFSATTLQLATAQTSHYTDSECSNASKKKRNKSIGKLLGGVGGGLLGREIAGDDDKALGTVIGVFSGAIVGGEIAKILTPCDKELVGKASKSALETGSAKTWKNTQTGRSGTVTVAPSTVQVAGHEGKFCRVKKDEIVDPNSGATVDTATYCKGTDGTWARV